MSALGLLEAEEVHEDAASKHLTLTVIVPAHNKAAGLADTLESLLRQTRPAERIIVVDDCSTDETPQIALSFADQGVETITSPTNLGSKARAQNFALRFVDSDLVLPLDGDTMLDANYIEKLVPVFDDPMVSVASGCVLTQKQDTVWERARQLEYLFGFHWYRTIQQRANSVALCSGCCTLFRREWLNEGFPETTLTEDIYYTWAQHIAGRKSVYVHDAVARAAEPISAKYMSTQLKRWKCGWFHGFRWQWLKLLRHKPMVALWSGLQFLETALAPVLLTLPFVAYFRWNVPLLHLISWWLMGDLMTFWPPVLYGCFKRKFPVWKAVISYPAWYALKAINLRWDMHMLWREMVLVPLRLKKPWIVYERGKA